MFNSGAGTTNLWRVAAFVLLLCAAFDLFAVDTALLRPANSTDSDCGCPSDEDCFCCCRHIVIVPAVTFMPMQAVAEVEQQPLPRFHSIHLPVPYHPPRA